MLKHSKIISLYFLLFAFSSCKSFKEKVVSKKSDFIQIAQRHAHGSETGGFKSLAEVIDHVKQSTAEDELRYLGVDSIVVSFPNNSSSKTQLDSTVVFFKGNNCAIYDFAFIPRDLTKDKYHSLEMVEERLYVGKFK